MLEVIATWLELAELVSAWLLWLLVDELDAVLDELDELEHPANKNRAAPRVRVPVIILCMKLSSQWIITCYF